MLDKHYDHVAVENGKYEKWVSAGYFTAGEDKSKPTFSLVIPPPNVTGKLHLGHVMDTVPDDIVARYKRMKGFDVFGCPAWTTRASPPRPKSRKSSAKKAFPVTISAGKLPQRSVEVEGRIRQNDP
jgi:valyl-tRNA synthetase